MDELLKNITPGHHFIASIGDTMPPDADFDCLMYIGERFEKDGGMSLAAGSARPMDEAAVQAAGERDHRRARRERAPRRPKGDGWWRASKSKVRRRGWS